MNPVSSLSEGQVEALAQFLAKERQLLLPMIELVEQAEVAIDERIDVM